MSELKAWKANDFNCNWTGKWYKKEEADKVIAEKDEKIVLYKIGFEESKKINTILYKRELHHKYKRCLDKVKICEDKLGTVVKPGWWDKWHKRWLELAKHYKEAK